MQAEVVIRRFPLRSSLLAGLVFCGGAGAGAAFARGSARPVVIVQPVPPLAPAPVVHSPRVTVPAPVVIQVPAPPAPPPVEAAVRIAPPGTAGCAPSPDDVGVPFEMIDTVRARGGQRRPAITHVAASSRACVIAVSDGTRVLASFDDGRSFAPALDAPGPVRSLAVTPDGAVVVLRGPDLLGLARAGGAAVWRRQPVTQDGATLHATNRWLAIIVESVLAFSGDEGVTWRYGWLPEERGGAPIALRIDDDGAVRLAAPHLYLARVDDLRWRKLWTAREEVGSAAFGDGGWLYATIGDDSERVKLVAVSPQGKMTALTPRSRADIAVWPHEVAGNGDAVVADLANFMAPASRGRLGRSTCWGEQCSPDLGQSPWPEYALRAVDGHGLPLARHRDREAMLVRLAPGGERLLVELD